MSTGIEWTDETWNPVTGCTKVSPGCDHCYAERITERFHGPGSFEKVVLHEDRLGLPLRWRKPRRVFVNSMSDLFHDEVPDAFIAEVFAVMAATPRHIYQVLTKRHARMRSLTKSKDFWSKVNYAYCCIPDDRPGFFGYQVPLPNVWLGVSVEDQKWADIRIPALLDTPAAVRWASLEPLLGPVDLTWCAGVNALEQDWIGGPGGGTGARHPFLDWVVVGGESGAGHRPMDVAWLESIAEQCRDAAVPLFVKQDSGPRAGQQGRIPDDLWALKQFPGEIAAMTT